MFAAVLGLRHKLSGTGILMAGIFLCAFILLVSLVVGVRAARAGSGTQGLRVAVVDLSGVFRASEEWKDYEAKRRDMLEKMERTLGKLQRQAQVLRSEYQNLAPGTEERASKRQELQEALQKFQETQNNFQQDVSQKYNDFLYTMFTRVSEEVKKYAEENEIDVVLKKTRLEKSPAAPEQTDLLIATANVLYAGQRVDITDQIAERLNANYPGQIEVK